MGASLPSEAKSILICKGFRPLRSGKTPLPVPTGNWPLTVGLSLFGAAENGVDISFISVVMVIAPLLISLLTFQRQFVQAFLNAGVK